MNDRSLRILGAAEVEEILIGRETEIMELVGRAYQIHVQGQTSLPHSTFLRFPDRPANRIIALPAYLGEGFDVAGIKWIASAPANIERGLDRASAVVVLNDPETGRPHSLLEGSGISASRTAASAALAARVLHRRGVTPRVGLIGCGRINLEVARFLRAAFPDLSEIDLFDIQAMRALQLKEQLEEIVPGVTVRLGTEAAVLAESDVVSFATTATVPHVADLSACRDGATILHISLRDLTAEVVLANDVVVDDVDHVCRAQTSVHLAELACGHRTFIRSTLGDILLGRTPARPAEARLTLFNPFGLGILDIALAAFVQQEAQAAGLGRVVPSFQADSTAVQRRRPAAVSASAQPGALVG